MQQRWSSRSATYRPRLWHCPVSCRGVNSAMGYGFELGTSTSPHVTLNLLTMPWSSQRRMIENIPQIQKNYFTALYARCLITDCSDLPRCPSSSPSCWPPAWRCPAPSPCPPPARAAAWCAAPPTGDSASASQSASRSVTRGGSCHVMSRHVTWHHVMSCYVMSRHVAGTSSSAAR